MRLRNLLVFLFMLVGGVIAAAVIVEQYQRRPTTRVLAVPAGDREIAWFHTSTNGAAWEHLIAGIHRACRDKPELAVDDSKAFLESTVSVPEVVISWKNRPGALRIRWYKQTSETGTKEWIDALAERNPAPLAIIGGGSSDRARDLARELNEREQWKGPRPLFLITTATAEEVALNDDSNFVKLIEIYPRRSFRFCFTNRQMANAVVDFVWDPQNPHLRPQGPPPGNAEEPTSPSIFRVIWKDDPYSRDLSEELKLAVQAKMMDQNAFWSSIDVPYSVGLFDRVNQYEESAARQILSEIQMAPGQRSLLILPTSVNQARRFLRALAGESPLIGKHLVAITGDSIGINDVYRDGALLWNMRDVPVPLVFFAHQNPVGWDTADLQPPGGTDEVLLFARMVDMLIRTAYPPDEEFAADSDVLRERMRTQRIVPFDEEGNRKEGEEYVAYLRPEINDQGRVSPQASLEVWRRSRGQHKWRPVATLQAPFINRSTNRGTDNP